MEFVYVDHEFVGFKVPRAKTKNFEDGKLIASKNQYLNYKALDFIQSEHLELLQNFLILMRRIFFILFF